MTEKTLSNGNVTVERAERNDDKRAEPEAPPMRVIFPVLLGVVFLGVIAGISVLGIMGGKGNSSVVAVLGSISSAAVGGIAGMLSLVFQQHRSGK